MPEAKDNSSLPLLLSITGAVVAVAVGGWFLLNQQSVEPGAEADTPVEMSPDGIDAIATLATEEIPEPSAEIESSEEAETATASLTDEDKLRVDTELAKARLAADADILVLPEAQSALFYYGRVLSIDAQHEVAAAELDAMLAKVSQTVTEQLTNEEYEDAYQIAVLVAQQVPEHPLVIATQTALDTLTEDLVRQSISAAQDGDDNQADELLATALALPGRNPNYFNAIRDSIAEIRTVREAAERDRAQRAQLAADDARQAWVERTQAAISAGNLIAPAGASAKDLLAENNSWASEREQLTGEMRTALLITADLEIDNRQLAYAENLLSTAIELDADVDEVAAVRAALESALIEEESNRVVPVSDLVVVKTTPPRYPSRAAERNISGWVDVYFTVTADGNTENIEVSASEPETTFDRAAMKAVDQWIFEPSEYRGQIISRRAATRLVFVLE